MDTIIGTVKKILFRSEENGFCIASVCPDAMCFYAQEDGNVVVKGTFLQLKEGEYLRLHGEGIMDKKYGQQFIVHYYESVFPENLKMLEHYLSKGIIKGIGKVRAKAIISQFGKNSIRIMEEEPLRLTEISGIGKRTAEVIGKHAKMKGKMQEILLELGQYGISPSLGNKICQKYQEDTLTVVQKNPYQLIQDIRGIGFTIADKIAIDNGISKTSHYRIKNGLLYQLENACHFGNVCYPKDKLLLETEKLLGVEKIEEQYEKLLAEGKLVCVHEKYVYTKKNYEAEQRTAARIKNICSYKADLVFDSSIPLEGSLDDIQMDAVKTAAEHNMTVLTGGPGVGKTTTTNLMIQYFEKKRKKVLLAAPTGRAAKRMKEATGRNASTIHRLLCVQYEQGVLSFYHNAETPLHADVIIIDETSMLDLFLMEALIDAIRPGTQLILVGDKNQLPSVGPGNVLADIISSGICPVIELTKVYRQAEGSYIISNAHAILHQHPIRLSKDSKDFFFKSCSNPQEIKDLVLHYAVDSLPEFTGESNVQILSPLRGRTLGTQELNLALQEKYNPLNGRAEVGGFREGDKVIQTVNNYDMDRTKNGRHESGVFNGDVGRITKIDVDKEYVWVTFDDGWESCYDFDNLDDLNLAYALTIHKSQGSEYPVVVIPIYDYIPMLTTMNLLYTGITRAKKAILLIGSPERLMQITRNVYASKRYTGLCSLLKIR